MRIPLKVRTVVATASLLAVASIFGFGVFLPPSLSGSWLIAFLTLFTLAILTEFLALRMSDRGSLTSLEFVPHLAAIKLIGPFGAVALTAISVITWEKFFTDKPTRKVIFNTAQFVISVAVAALVFLALGGNPNLYSLGFPASLPPFIAAAVAYFLTNSALVSVVISLSEEQSLAKSWTEIKGPILLFDVAISPVAYLVALLYVQWGGWGLLIAVVPLAGLRYMYGVNIRLQQLNQDLLRVLVKTIEAQDAYTSGHSLRVAQYARTLAEELNLRQDKIQKIETAALLHDIGKIDRAYRQILRQEGPLTDNQRKLIQAHPERGVEILQSVRSLGEDILAGVQHHHEHYDGSGYPDGLSEKQIPISARIIMVADTIDAMLTPRSYRDPLTIPDVKKELRDYSGQQFDPAVVNVALNSNLFSLVEDNLKSLELSDTSNH